LKKKDSVQSIKFDFKMEKPQSVKKDQKIELQNLHMLKLDSEDERSQSQIKDFNFLVKKLQLDKKEPS